ncbi:MAG: hypothetical protein U9P81_05605 [Euryarchaeota archaeon]|nr:hypothetical protein [Euryarchaeota archaeon]
MEWTAVIGDNSNYYQLMLNSSVDITAGETLQFNAIGPDAGQSIVIEHTVTTSELQDAIHHWLDDEPVRGYVLLTSDLQEVIAVWLT